MTYARDIDIGKPKKESVTVENLASIVTALETATAKIEEATEELKKVVLGTGLVTGINLDEEEINA